MRRLAIFFLSFSISMKASEMYHTTALQCHTALTYSIRTYECDIHTLKAGVKVALYYLLKRFAKVCTCIHLINDCDDKVADIWFFEVLEPNYHNLQVATFVTGIWSIQNPGLAFVHWTPWPGCVLTVFNALQGGEPARIAVSEWEDAGSNSWLEPKHLQGNATDHELSRLCNLQITYQDGRG